MAEIKGIDVSSWNGKIDWKTVADYGMGFAILRVHQKSGIDSTFEYNYKGCIENKIPVGVYKYSYAKTVAQAEKEAQDVLNVLNGRKLDYPVFYDLEWSEQRALGSAAIEKIAVAFLNKIEKAGYKVGLYANVDWHSHVFTNKLRQYDCWLAAYPANDNGTLQERLRPSSGIGWQYSSKAVIPGVGTVDRNVFYKDYTSTTNNTGGTTVAKMTLDQAIDKVIAIAEAEIGYLEKRSNSQLDSKTANAGSANYTKYWRDLYPKFQCEPWCAIFVTWVLVQAFGRDAAEKLLKHYPYVYCPTLGNLFTKNANPKRGDIVIFYRNGTFTHTGLVKKVNGDKFWTIEGNTSGASGIIANGGGVCEKSYYNSQMVGTKFCTPDYVSVLNLTTTSQPSTSKPTSTSKQPTTLVGQAKLHLNNFIGTSLKVTNNVRTHKAKVALRKAVQTALNMDYKAGLKVNGKVDAATKAALRNVNLKNGSKGYLVTVLEIALLFNKINPNGVECPGICGANCVKAIKAFQKKKGLKQDGEAGVITITALLK